MTAKTNKPHNRFQAFYLRQLAKGLKMVHVWIPKEKALALKDYARSLRNAVLCSSHTHQRGGD